MEKLEALKVGEVQKEKKRHFVSWKAYFSSYYFFYYSFSFAFQKMIFRAWGSTPIAF